MPINAATEARRLDTLAQLDILDTPREPAFDRLTALCKRIFGVQMSTLTLIDGHRQWFKAEVGMADRETDRRPALCSLAIEQDTPLVIPDTHEDPRVADNIFVRERPFIRFYAGVQLKISGVNIGTLCIMDATPRQFDAEALGILADLAAVAVDELLLRNLSMQDNLTGALSRRAFRAEAERLASLANRHGHKLTLAVLDVDHFKGVNDRYGHAVGDAVLSSVIATCRRSLRGSDIVGRIGGEEFAILLPHTDLASGMAAIEKTRVAIAGQAIDTPCGPVPVTCSFGAASLLSGQHFDDALRNADLAMYSAKNAGRNQTIAWVDPAPSISPARRRVFKAGQITFNSGRSTFDCTVRALSEDEATIEVISTADVPDQFKLAIASDGLSRACRMVSKRDTRVDVAFV
ncbi:sensor domain-containing diguanylate cyclase [Bradyrhizobium liaoningense]|uniref:sensor domain-containing diguanylate cyclase n=1 Tax=Bradyrhizobium liaoningense TaxID=43992 RepID=UPI001BAA9607|nr:sensor domain-containing diguanylate cyclase [Bradyrhizobium liaoningense]MBR0818619.1 sensor domain-containing diguanylate cyclase [Bradyrhizobium liaoningense]